MGKNVYANGNRVAAKHSGNKTMGTPDVCHSPPPPPATPNIGVPIPYLNFSNDSKTANGTKTVKIKRQEASLKNKSSYKTSNGDEPATPGLNRGIISHKIKGEAKFVAWSFNVKFERKNVCRHLDMMTHNNGNC